MTFQIHGMNPNYMRIQSDKMCMGKWILEKLKHVLGMPETCFD